ncbi:hypothetical protein CHS0354_030785 [Potamilus streckersoni]|uniref:WD repeat-containing protein n=1 Tax=Potamilus streckersoni TaxID=2493646 RepID=A0AAE0TDD8_9BIVA|nr:hypothetical protein CHS0354_030785 [Potamilus streckersoni]
MPFSSTLENINMSAAAEVHPGGFTSQGLPGDPLQLVIDIPGAEESDADSQDLGSEASDSYDDLSSLSEIGEEDEEGSENEFRVRPDPVFEKIKESLSRTQKKSESALSVASDVSDGSGEGPLVQISEQYSSIPYGIQPRATYEHAKTNSDIMGVAYNSRMRQFLILDSKGITTWKRDMVDPRVRRALQHPKYEYRLIINIVYAAKYNCYFALGKDFSLKVLNRDFEETFSVNADLRSVLFMLFNPVKDELITGGVGGIKVWCFKQVTGQAFQDLKPLANYRLFVKYTLPDVGGSWVKRVDLDHQLQHLYCCSDTDLHVYDLNGKLLFRFERAHTMSITGCCYSPTAKFLVTSSVDSEVKVWSLTGGQVHTFRGHSRAVTSMILHPDCASIVITASLDGSIRMWSLDFMDLLYMIVVSTDGVLWMGLTDDKLLYVSTCRYISLWSLNYFYQFWGLARNQLTNMYLSGCKEKTTRLVALGEDSSVRLFIRSNRRNITTVLPPPDISPLQKVLSLCYSREFNVAFLLVSNKEIWVYTTRTDPSCRIAVWDVHELQMPYTFSRPAADSGEIQQIKTSSSVGHGVSHRATENGNGNDVVANCCSLCILNSTAMMWTDEGFCCPIRHSYLLLGLEDGRILFMDPVVKGQKFMEFKASKDAIRDMRQDISHSCLITLSRLKQLMLVQIWGLPQLDLNYELYSAPDINICSRLGLTFFTGHETGHLNFHFLEPAEDLGLSKAKQEPEYDEVVEKRRPEHNSRVVALDSVVTLRIFISASADGAIKVWDENKMLLTEIMMDESLSSACFLNDLGDVLIGFKNHIFFIDHSRICPHFKPPEIEMETSDQESDVYEDPSVLYEGIIPNPDPLTKDNYLVPYQIEFSRDFLEGKLKIEHKKAKTEETASDSDSTLSMAPTYLYYSPPDSPGPLSNIDMTLGAGYSDYDLYKHMEFTMQEIGPKRHRRHIGLMGELPGISDKEDDRDVREKRMLPMFGASPGPSPEITPPPSARGSPTPEKPKEEQVPPGGESVVKIPKDFKPVKLGSEPARVKKVQRPGSSKPEAEDVPGTQEESTRRRPGLRGIKVDVHGLMKEERKKRITSGRAPSLTRRSSTDHSHPDLDHDHDHDHDALLKLQQQKKQRNQKKKEQQMMQDRKMPKRGDPLKMKPPSMLDRQAWEFKLKDYHPPHELKADKDKHESEKPETDGMESDRGSVINLDSNAPETQMQRHSRLGNRFVEDEKAFDPNNSGMTLKKKKVNVYLPRDDRDDIQTPNTDLHESYRATPDSGIGESAYGHTSSTSAGKRLDKLKEEEEELSRRRREALLFNDLDKTDEEQLKPRPNSSYMGLRKRYLSSGDARARPQTAHVKFRAEDLQAAFEEAMQRYCSLPGTPADMSENKLYKNDGTGFGEYWPERVIERHLLLKMQKEIRSQSAAQRRQARETQQQEKLQQNILNTDNRSKSGVETARPETTFSSFRSQTISTARPPTTRPQTQKEQYPNTSHSHLQQQNIKSQLKAEKSFRFKMSTNKSPSESSRPSSSRSSISDFSPKTMAKLSAKLFDPRNPKAIRPKSCRSIPSKCSQYVLVSKKENSATQLPSPLEEQLLMERFPKMGLKVLQGSMEPIIPSPRKTKKIEYSPFIYQRFS